MNFSTKISLQLTQNDICVKSYYILQVDDDVWMGQELNSTMGKRSS